MVKIRNLIKRISDMDDLVFNELLQGIKDALGELKDSQKEIQKDIGEIKITQAEQHITLVDHTKRRTANEEEIKLVRTDLQRQLEPLKKDNWKFKGDLAFLGLIRTI